mgnify:CR=1 FL=1
MRLVRVISFIVTLLVLSAGCNDDVFIERLEASQTEFKVPSLGGKFEIMFSHGDWNVERIAVDRVDVDGAIHEENGEEVTTDAILILRLSFTITISPEP